MLLPKAMHSPSPLISVIVVCKNPGAALPQTIGSVLQQQPKNYEIVVVDGGSDDGTGEWLRVESPRIGTFLTEPDTGIYDAMNKGIALARGEWIIFLGAGDVLSDRQVFSRVAASLSSPGNLVVSGEVVYDDGRWFRNKSTATAPRRNFLHHQGTFYRRKLFALKQAFDTSLKIAADYDFNLQLLRNKVPFTFVSEQIAICGSGGASDSGRWLVYREEITVRHRYFPVLICVGWDLGSVGRYLRKKILRAAARQRPEYLPRPNRPEMK